MEALRLKEKRIFTVKIAKRVVLSLIFVLFFNLLLFPLPTLAADSVKTQLAVLPSEEEIAEQAIIDNDSGEISDVAAYENSLPENKDLKVAWETYRTLTAYNSEVGQCDDTPCITANGFNVCEHGLEDTIAANWLKFGTKVRIPEIYGDRVFVVRDRMNKRFPSKVDIWMVHKTDAKKFGVKIAKIEVLEEP